MVVWIAWWACVDVLFHVLFLTRPPTVVSEVCQCVCSTPKSQPNTQLCSWSTIHPLCPLPITNNAMPFSMPHQSIMLLPQLFFLLLNVVFFIVVLVIIESVWLWWNASLVCTNHQHVVGVSLWCHSVWPSLCFGALVVMPVVHHAIVFHTHAPHLDSGCC